MLCSRPHPAHHWLEAWEEWTGLHRTYGDHCRMGCRLLFGMACELPRGFFVDFG